MIKYSIWSPVIRVIRKKVEVNLDELKLFDLKKPRTGIRIDDQQPKENLPFSYHSF